MDIQSIADHLRGCSFEHTRAVLELGDVMVLLDYLEGQGFVSAKDGPVAEDVKTEGENQ